MASKIPDGSSSPTPISNDENVSKLSKQQTSIAASDAGPIHKEILSLHKTNINNLQKFPTDNFFSLMRKREEPTILTDKGIERDNDRSGDFDEILSHFDDDGKIKHEDKILKLLQDGWANEEIINELNNDDSEDF